MLAKDKHSQCVFFTVNARIRRAAAGILKAEPMNETHPRKWVYLISYLLLTFVSLGLLFFIAEWFFPKTSSELIPNRDALSAIFISRERWNTPSQDTKENAGPHPPKEKLIVQIDQGKTFGKSKIIYRGLDGNSLFKIDVVILELDPHAYYRYRIPIDDARKGFRLAGQNFRLISARTSAIQIWHLKNSNSSDLNSEP